MGRVFFFFLFKYRSHYSKKKKIFLQNVTQVKYHWLKCKNLKGKVTYKTLSSTEMILKHCKVTLGCTKDKMQESWLETYIFVQFAFWLEETKFQRPKLAEINYN